MTRFRPFGPISSSGQASPIARSTSARTTRAILSGHDGNAVEPLSRMPGVFAYPSWVEYRLAGLVARSTYIACMATEEARLAAAAGLRALSHAFAAHDPEDDVLAAIRETATDLACRIDEAPVRDRLALMRSRPDGSVLGGRGFEDRAVGGWSNPTSIELEVRYDNDEVVADFVLRRAFEGAPGRAHGGIVAAAFDDVTGFVIGKLQEPAFTGELTVRYRRTRARRRAAGDSCPTRRAGAPQALHQCRSPRRRSSRCNVPRDLHHRRPVPLCGRARSTLTRSRFTFAIRWASTERIIDGASQPPHRDSP